MPKPQRIPPGPGEESVWDYPRPPRVEDSTRHVRVVLDGTPLAEAHRARRVLETSGPPVYYIPPEDVRMDLLQRTDHTTICEWKGVARYYTLVAGERTITNVAWSYPNPNPGYESVRDYIAFYPGKVEAYLDDERVRPQPGSFYGGWITHEIVGPFKGEPGTEGW